LVSPKDEGYPVKSLTGKTLFFLDKKATGAVPYNDRLTIILRLAAVLFLLIFIHRISERVAVKKGVWSSIGLLTVMLFLVRVVSYYDPSLLNLRQFELFNPAIYGSNLVQRSLGDLLINAIMFCWIILFAWSKLQHFEKPVAKFSIKTQWIAAIVSLSLLILCTFLLSSLVRSIVADSRISFDVTDFYSLNQYTVIGFVVLAALSLSYFYLTQLLFRLIFPLFEGRAILIYFSISVVGLIYLTTQSGNPAVLFYIPVLMWLLLYTFLVHRQRVVATRLRVNIAGILLWIFIFSMSLAAIMLAENKKVEWERRKIFIDKMVVQSDPSSERLLSISLQYLDNDFLAENFERFRDEKQNKYLRDSIIAENYAGYLNKYDTYLYLYDSANNPLYNDEGSSYDDLNTIITIQSKPANTPGLFYFESSYDQFAYITKRDIVDSANDYRMGSLFIISNPKKYSSDALFPELFKKFKKNNPENSPIYSSAVYDTGRLTMTVNSYPFPTYLTPDEVPKEQYVKRNNGDFDELWYRANKNKVVVMARKRDTIVETITLFSYIFCSFLFMVMFVQLVSALLKIPYRKEGLRKIMQLNIRNQVHSTIIFISIFSFVIIGISTISFFINRYKRNNNEKLSRTMIIMVNEMQKKLSDHQTFDDVLLLYDTASGTGLQELVNEVSGIHGVDVNVYDLNGNLYVSSAPNVYTKGVVSRKMEPTAFYHLNRMRQSQHSQEEKIGDLSYLSIYAPVRDDRKNIYAYLNIPYFTTQPELKLEISNFLVTMINLNAFIFLIAGLIALFITNRITRSFSLISDKMRQVNLGKMNEEIEWNRDDEIGQLVIEYNKMVAKLEASASALAKSEREGAWREMARQVAHEIKNPLTPMKLSIQYLQKAIDNNQPNVKELSSNVAHTLVEQIDHLSKIAADFSQFSNIGNTNMTLFDLHDVIGSLKELYSADENVHFAWNPVNDTVMVYADKTQMNRLFTNLFTNALEACQERTDCRVEINEMVNEGMIIISVKDNGEGIAPEMQSRIFVPNFTTKSSGTGLGLAMCTSIVEQAKGRIWFETEQGKGTTFFVELPLGEKAASF
jgi:signal transduction histidine kinase